MSMTFSSMLKGNLHWIALTLNYIERIVCNRGKSLSAKISF